MYYWIGIILFFTLNVLAESNVFVLFGGAGDSLLNKTTVSDYSGPTLVQLDKARWSTMAAFGGEHDHLTKKLKEHLDPDAITDFTPEKYEAHISMLESLIEEGAIKAGDQLMIAFDSHGSDPKKNNDGGSIHYVSAIDRQKVSLQRLQKLTELAVQKKVKLAILDMSCFGGASLALANSATCVVSISKGDQLASSTEANWLAYEISAAKPGVSLEDVYLKARAHPGTVAQPQISTPTHQQTEEILWNLNPRIRSLQESYNAYLHDRKRCVSQKSATKDLIAQMMNIFEKRAQEINDEEGFNEYRRKFEALIRTRMDFLFKRQEQLSSKVGPAYHKMQLQQVCFESFNICKDPEDVDLVYESMKDAWVRAIKKGDLVKAAELEKKVKQVQSDLLDSPKFQPYRDWIKLKAKDPAFAEYEKINEEIASLAREAYDVTYRELMKTRKGSNPCADFKF